MINSSYNRGAVDGASYANNYSTNRPYDSIVKENEAKVKTTNISYEQKHLDKVEQIKTQLASGSYKIQDSKALASSFVDAEFQ